MEIEAFIKEHRKELAEYIVGKAGAQSIDNDEIELWINNDEKLYDWAREEGVEF